jgi:hypothetical protein
LQRENVLILARQEFQTCMREKSSLADLKPGECRLECLLKLSIAAFN